MAGLSGCSTPGPAHLYLYSPAAGENSIRDVDPRSGAELAKIPAYNQPGEYLLGIAYDPFTDHLFLRLFPGNHVRVVDRPAAAIKRSFIAPNLPLGGHDLAIRSRDRHLFFTDPTGPALIETDHRGELVGHLVLTGLQRPVCGVAHDALADELLVLPDITGDRLLRYSLDGALVRETKLELPVQGYSLAYDSTTGETFASLADGSAIGVFDPQGRLLRRLSRPAANREVFIDTGQRSLLRLF
ncbi:MAG: hypothetical protein MUE42_12560 [Opitutaceae bacterium]|nr:hypothetical protein [Opitutaceae bacterium]